MILQEAFTIQVPWLPPASQRILLSHYLLASSLRWLQRQKMPSLAAAHALPLFLLRFKKFTPCLVLRP
jgi:hypothetical protein